MVAFAQTQLACGATRVAQQKRNRLSATKLRAYGDKAGEKGNTYIDLEDMDNTVGSWARYADDDPKRYPALQEEFFERAAAPLTDWRVQLGFTSTLFGLLASAYFFKGVYDLKLPSYTVDSNRYEKYLAPPNVCFENAPPVSPLCFP